MIAMKPPSCRVLIAGDLQELRPLLEDIRSRTDLDLVEVQDGAAAIRSLRDGQAEVALVDLVLPDMSGLHVVREVSKMKRVPIIVIAQEEDARVFAEARKLGAANCLIKPLAGDPLLRALDDAVAAVPPPSGDTLSQEIEAQIQQERRLVELGRIATDVAHDLNNQMAVILGYTGMLLQGPARMGEVGLSVDQIHAAAERASNLTSQILTYGRKQPTELQPLDLHRQLAKMETLIHKMMGENIEVIVDLQATQPYVMSAPAQLDHVLMNLLTNARDAMAGRGKLALCTKNILLEDETSDCSFTRLNDYIMLVISDSGCGMDAATQARIFEPFFTTKPVGRGTGLGMSIVRKFLNDVGGRIDVSSIPGQGTTVTLYLPQVSPLEQPTGTSSVETLPGGTETILVVEDDEAVRTMLRHVLGRQGYQVLEARDACEAMNLVRDHEGSIDLLITDMGLPLMNGRALADCLLTSHPNLKVLFISGYDAWTMRERGHGRPGDAFVQKPFKAEYMLQQVRQILG
jgi:signal transduction histidine kinase